MSESLNNRVYYAARDGMPVSLVTLLQDRPAEEIKELLSQVSHF